MAHKDQLQVQGVGTVINATSKAQEKDLIKALEKVAKYLDGKFPRFRFIHEKSWHLKDIVSQLQENYPKVDFLFHYESSFIRPDGGFLCIKSKQDENLAYPVLISEVKNQGTNDQRKKKGLDKQARGNAIERLGKNLIGLRTALLGESIFTFVCFGYGCDFEEGSSILDPVATMAMFGKLNKTHLYNCDHNRFNR